MIVGSNLHDICLLKSKHNLLLFLRQCVFLLKVCQLSEHLRLFNNSVSALSSFQRKDHDIWIACTEPAKLQTLLEKLMVLETVQGVFQLCQYLAF